jgi:16S rRNA processing protein RimM
VNWDEMALVGRVARPHGIRGQVIVNPDTDFPGERFQAGAQLFVQRGGKVEPITLASVRFHRQRPIIAVIGVDDADQAATLAGLELRIPIEWLSALPSGMFYRHDLVGCLVETRTGERVGMVKDVEGDAGGSRLVVETNGGEVLVPLAQEICPVIDVVAKRIVVVLPEGLLELNADRRRHHLSGDGRAGAGGRHRRARH